ncbi:uncharacterized protein LOC127850435 isoform X1 [Dreissena polymorpha]|nr:uncharacterized protein LOC127850435 isoform X1 [Dreissena polymorpha]XP_052239428.1 uncharacterized protein LOC127850435 isoform X1 [Dreissena polymorpha]
MSPHTTTVSSKTPADTTRADTMASDGNLSNDAIVAISVNSGVALILIVVVVSCRRFRALRTGKSHTSVGLHSPANHTLDDTNIASCQNNEHEEDDLDGTVYHSIYDTHIASSHSNVHEAQGYESLSRYGDHDNHAYFGISPADNTVVLELRDYEIPDSHMYLDLEPRNGNTNDEHRCENV